MSERRTHLLLLSERIALAWVLREQRMAFAPHRAADARALNVGDRLSLYTTRGCFHNPTRDRGRIIADALVASRVADLDEPLTLAGRTFTVGCRLRIPRLAPLHRGVALAPLVPGLTTFPNPRGWSTKLRQTLVALEDEDVPLIEGLLTPLLRPRTAVLDEYLAAASEDTARRDRAR